MGEWSWVIKGFVLYTAAMFVLRVCARGLTFARRQFEAEQAQAELDRKEQEQKKDALKIAAKDDEVMVAERADDVMLATEELD
ncbi:MAG: hypothetical protein IT449_14590 [Phycisphaerales bacterium]|nr:hypothetical protein [Phycisphaerales bacterium]